VRGLARPLLVAACLAQVIVPLVRIATSYRATELSLSASQVLILSSAFSLLPAFLAVAIGRYNDRHGNGRASAFGAALIAFGCAMLMIHVPSVWWLILVSVVLGFGQTVQLTGLQGEVAMFRLSRHRDGMVGNLMLWQAVGQVAAPLILSLVALSGGQLSLRLAAVSLTLALVCGGVAMLLWRNAAAPQSASAAEAGMYRILATPGLGWVLLAGSLCVAVHDLTLVYMPVIGAERGIPPAAVGVLLTLFAGGQMLSRGLYRRVVSHVGQRRLMLAGVIGTAAFTAALALPVGSVAIGLLLGLIGLSMGFAITSSVSLTIAMAPPRARATSLGLRLAMNRAGQFLISLAAGGAAATLGPGAVFLVLGSTLGGVGLYGRRLLGRLA
jgi:MFS family permease